MRRALKQDAIPSCTVTGREMQSQTHKTRLRRCLKRSISSKQAELESIKKQHNEAQVSSEPFNVIDENRIVRFEQYDFPVVQDDQEECISNPVLYCATVMPEESDHLSDSKIEPSSLMVTEESQASSQNVAVADGNSCKSNVPQESTSTYLTWNLASTSVFMPRHSITLADENSSNNEVDSANNQNSDNNDPMNSDDDNLSENKDPLADDKNSDVNSVTNPEQLSNNDNVNCTFTNEERRIRKYTLKNHSRKRTINKNNWKDVAAKRARNSGNAGDGRNGTFEGKTMKAGCGTSCRYKCSSKLSEDERKSAFQLFYGLGDKTKQWQCIKNWVHEKKTAQNKTSNSSDEESSDSSSKIKKYQRLVFTLPSQDSGAVSVCLKMFLNTLDISYSQIKTARKKVKYTDSTVVIAEDQRGKHLHRPHRVDESLKDRVRRHILSLPTMDSHDCKEGSSRKYLDRCINSISMMYRLYEKEMEGNLDLIVSKQMYSHIFNTEFNYGFFDPKKARRDQCDVCKHQPAE